MRPRSVAVGAIFVAAAGGCASSTTGTPAVDGGTSAAPVSASPDSASPSNSTRPRTINLQNKDICATVPPAQLTELGYRPPVAGVTQTSPTQFGCDFRYLGPGSDGTSLFFDSARGYEQYSTSSPGVTVTPIDVAGFPAYEVQNPRFHGCTVGVDVAESQSLAATTTESSRDAVAPLCEKSALFAAAAITALSQS